MSKQTARPASSSSRMWLCCQAACTAERYDPLQVLVSCPRCGGLVDPAFDLDAIAARAADLRHHLRERRAAPFDDRDRSGVWRFRDLFWPADDGGESFGVDDVVTLGEGNAARTRLPRRNGEPDVVIKQCGNGPTGSFKDLGMTVLSTWAKALSSSSSSTPPTLLCASTGDTSAALAAYGARAGLPVCVLLPADKISPTQLVQPLAHGAQVLAIDGDFDTCMRVVAELAASDDDGSIILANSKNPIRLLGQLTVALEIAEDGPVDVVCVPSGNLGNVSALYLGFQLARAVGLIDTLPRLVACQVEAANPLYRAVNDNWSTTSMTAAPTHASAIRIGAPVSLPRAKKALLATRGLVTSVDEAALLDASARADRCGLYVCPHTATALAGLEQLVARGDVGASDRVVVVSTASGLKFSEQKTAFHAGSTALGDIVLPRSTSSLRNTVKPVAASAAAVRAALQASS
ncbi:MAG TPA: threonine synthase [Myxococcota bacterium]